MLAMADQHGYVGASVPGLAARARVSLEGCIAALDAFMQPDQWSRTKDFEGRRIAETEGGWILLNHAKYRQQRNADERRDYMKNLMRTKRLLANVSSVSRHEPPLAQAEAEAEAEAKDQKLLSPSAKADPIPYQEIVNLYHQTLPTLPHVQKLTAKRKGQIAARWRAGDLPDLNTWQKFFSSIPSSDFLMGKTDPVNGHKRFVADLEWITNETNFAKIWEGKYHGSV